MQSHILPVSRANAPTGFKVSKATRRNRPFCDGDHIGRSRGSAYCS